MSDFVDIVNVTGHEITFMYPDGRLQVVAPYGAIVNAAVTEKPVMSYGAITLVTPQFMPTTSGRMILAEIDRTYPKDKVIIVGSIIAAQAYRGRVCAMVALPGFERVPPTEKRMDPFKFTIF